MHFSIRTRYLVVLTSLALAQFGWSQAPVIGGGVRTLGYDAQGQAEIQQVSCSCGSCGEVMMDDGCTACEAAPADSCTGSSTGCGSCLGCNSGGTCNFGGCKLDSCGLGGCGELGDQWSLWDTLTGHCEGKCQKCRRDPCSGECNCKDCGSQFAIGGWIQGGFHTNPNGLFNNHPDRFNLHQGWLYAERTADPGANGGLDWGFRGDIIYGVDAQDTQAFGNDPGTWDFQNGFDHGIYGWAIPQLYGEIATENVSVIFGHFYTLVGYEVVTAPDNFFYSHAYTMYNSEPFTHTGVLATITMTDNVTVYAGWTAGWDTGFDQRLDGSSFLGGFGLQLTDNAALTYITTAGNFGDRSAGTDAYSHSIVFDTQLTDKLNYVLQSDFVNVSATDDHDVGINQYLIYSLNDRIGIGQRIEWWQDDGTSINEYTVGLNVRPTANLIVRPEFRHDWSPATDLDQSTFGIDVIALF